MGVALCAFALAATLAADPAPAGATAAAPSPTSPTPAPAAPSDAAGSSGDELTTSGSWDLIAPLPASEAGSRTISLDQAVAAALAGNDDLSIAQSTLAAARAANAANFAKVLPSLSGNAAATMTDGFGDQTQAKTAGASGLGIGESLSGGLSLAVNSATAIPGSTTGTKIGITAAQAIPVSPQTQTALGRTTTVAMPQTTSVSATITQAVWDGYLGGQGKAVTDQSLLTLQANELTARQSRSTAVSNVKNAYVTVLNAQRGLALNLAIMDKQEALLRQIQATYAIKQASAVDLKTAQIAARTAELAVESSRHDFSLARQRLAVLIGLAPDADFRVAEIEVPALPAATLDEAIAKGLTNRADIAKYDIARKQAQINAALAIGSGQPSLVATGGIGLSYNWGAEADSAAGTAAVTAAGGQSISLGLRLQMPILDAGASRAALDQAKAQADLATTQAAQLRKNVTASIRDSWWNLQILAERTDLATQSVDLAESQLALTRQQVKFGTATNQDLVSASVTAANAEAALLAAKTNQLLAELALETAMGL